MIKGPQNGQRQVNRGTLANDLSTILDVTHHNTSKMHRFGEAFDVPGTPSDDIGGAGNGNPGVSDSPARADHTHGSVSGAQFYNLGGVNYFCTLGGSIPASGNLTMGTISIPAVSYNRMLMISGMMLVNGANSALVYQLSYTHIDGLLLGTRACQGNTMTLTPRAAGLSANTAFTISFIGACAAGATAAAVSSDARFSRGDVFLLPF